MPISSSTRPLVSLLIIAICAAMITASSLGAQSTPTGFAESYALAKDRKAVVANLIPGTEDWYYYRCRERLDARDFEAVRKTLPTWIKRHGRTNRVVEIENREALLSFEENPERTYSFLRNRLSVRFEHERKVQGARSDLASRLDPSLISPATLKTRAFSSYPNTVTGFTSRALASLATANLDDKQLHSLLKRVDQPDIANLPSLIVRDLSRRESRGFGTLRIHNLLRREHLDQCLELRRELLQNSRFVKAYLTRLQPDADTAWQEDATTRVQHLTKIWGFVRGLSPSFNSLKAHVLYHWLKHDLASGSPNKERFLSYIRLPRRQNFTAKSHLDRFQNRSEHVNPNDRYPTLMKPIGNDGLLVQRCLEHFFQTEDNIETYSNYLDANWLKRQLAETKILQGEGDMERWYSLLDDPSRLEQLEARVELRFPPTLKQHYGANEVVNLEIETKNVTDLLVKVFAIDSYRYHVEKQKAVDATIELDGVVPNFEQTHNYTEPPTRRVKRSFELPMLGNPGSYVVEFVGNGISSRAVIHKGGLRMVERTSAAGQVVRIYDEAGQRRPTATVWFGGREYSADENGDILLPFSTERGRKQLVLHDGNRSAIAPFFHRAESFSLKNSVHVDRESLIAGGSARLVIRPQLALSGHPVSIELLKDPTLTIIATDVDGQSTTQEVRNLKLLDGTEFIHAIRVPNRLATLSTVLSGQVEDLSAKKISLTGSRSTFSFNTLDATAHTGIPMLMRTPSGYVVELRGKSGEVQAGRVCRINLFHRDYRDMIDVALQTDEFGRIHLGRLPGIDSLQIAKDGGLSGSFQLAQADCRVPDVLHGSVGTTLRVPYQGMQTAASRSEFSLLGHNHDAFENLAIVDGFLEIRNLTPGDYNLNLHETGQRVLIRITKGTRDDRYLIGRDRVLSYSPTEPLQVSGVNNNGNDVEVQLAHFTKGTRVHVVATRYLPAYDMFANLRDKGHEASVARDQKRIASNYQAGRKLSDEYRYVLERRFAKKYAGNMLNRPSLLLNPMALEETLWNDAVGLGGGASGRYGARGGGRKGAPESARASRMHAPSPSAGIQANLDYLPQGSNLLANLKPDQNGTVNVPRKDLGPGHHVHVLAIDGHQTVYTTTVLAEQPLQPRSRTLPKALSAEKHFVETKRIQFVAANSSAPIEDARSAQVEVYDSISSIYRLFTTITNDDGLQSFSFILGWPSLTRQQKLDHYSQHACHELHFFINQKDPEFFEAVVRPFLANKLDKTFLDDWLLEADLTKYVDTWRFAQLNLIEKILLSQRISASARESTTRFIKESLELNPISALRTATLVDLALHGNRLAENNDATTLSFGVDAGEAAQKEDSPFDSNNWNSAVGLGGGAGRRDRKAKSPSGPATAGPAGPVTGSPAPPSPKTGSENFYLDQDKSNQSQLGSTRPVEQSVEVETTETLKVGEMRKRKNVVGRLFASVDSTKMLVEHNYWQRRAENPTTNLVRPSSFWVDYATNTPGEAFVSTSVIEATGSFLEMMMALSVIDLPFEAEDYETVTDGNNASLQAKTPLLLVRKDVRAAGEAEDMPPLLIGQNFYRLDDRYRFVGGQRRDAFVTNEFLIDVAYGCQVVITNPTSMPRTTDLLLQVPAGSVPLQGGFFTRGRSIPLGPYATATIEYSFYFPSTGEFAHYPAHAAEKGQLAAYADGSRMTVVSTPSKIDKTSWEHVSQLGSQAEVLAYLDSHNLKRLDLHKVAWRMRDLGFFQTLLLKLNQHHIYNDTLWSYGLLHRDAAIASDYLRHQEGFLDQCGAALESALVSIDPKERLRFQHIELSPLVHQRAHQLGSERKFSNAELRSQYAALMNLLGYHTLLDSNDWMAVTYYFLLQDRTEEALESFAKINPESIEAKIQYDYLSAYLCFFTGEAQKARRIATPHVDHPVAHWQKRFRTVIAQLDESEGKGAPTATEQSQDNLASTASALELAVEGRTVAISYKNLTAAEVRYYELDVEFAFSAQPFAGPDGASAAFVKPNHRETRSLAQDSQQMTFELPQQFWQKNVLIEVRAGGLVRSRQYFANAFDVRFLESYGQVAVTEPNTNKPLAKTYVKVFAKMPNGEVQFHKDGYTDLRGRFDYASLSDDPHQSATRYAVLVLNEQRGAVIREIRPPAR